MHEPKCFLPHVIPRFVGFHEKVSEKGPRILISHTALTITSGDISSAPSHESQKPENNPSSHHILNVFASNTPRATSTPVGPKETGMYHTNPDHGILETHRCDCMVDAKSTLRKRFGRDDWGQR
jgi:hypothetical protein